MNLILNLFGLSPSNAVKGQITETLKQLASTDIETTLEQLDFVAELLSEVISVSFIFIFRVSFVATNSVLNCFFAVHKIQ